MRPNKGHHILKLLDGLRAPGGNMLNATMPLRRINGPIVFDHQPQ
jgi:hypothetical protein